MKRTLTEMLEMYPNGLKNLRECLETKLEIAKPCKVKEVVITIIKNLKT